MVVKTSSSVIEEMCTSLSGEHSNVMCACRCTPKRQAIEEPKKKSFVAYEPLATDQFPHVPHVPITYSFQGLPIANAESNWVTLL